MNDIENSCDSNILSFADNTTIYSSHSDINSLFEMGNTEINNLYTWFCTNKLSLNAGKTKYIIIKPRQRHCDISQESEITVQKHPLNLLVYLLMKTFLGNSIYLI